VARKPEPKPRLMYSTVTEKHYDNGLAEYLKDGKWVEDRSNLIGK
jgi:hypothetical protein